MQSDRNMDTVQNKKEYRTKKYVFIIEDSKEVQNLVHYYFEKLGYEMDSASDGEEALFKLRHRKELPGLILLDLKMPRMDGFQFRILQELDSELSQIPVVVMSADHYTEVHAIRMGAHGHIKKPFTSDALLSTAEKYCS